MYHFVLNDVPLSPFTPFVGQLYGSYIWQISSELSQYRVNIDLIVSRRYLLKITQQGEGLGLMVQCSRNAIIVTMQKKSKRDVYQ